MIVYLAGPDVFLADAREVGAAKVARCREAGIEALFPLDLAPPVGPSPAETGLAIFRANLALVARADAVLANLTPFRGASADVGTAMEVGLFAAAGKPVFAYSSDPRPFAERTRACLGLASDAERDDDGLLVEDFGLPDNLMLPGAAATAGGWFARAASPGREIAAMLAFEAALAAAKMLSM